MIKRRKRVRMNVRPLSVIRSEAHLKWVRGHQCLIAHKHICAYRIQAHHIYKPGDAKGHKPGDDQTIPLCGGAHDEGHRIGWESFDKQYGLKEDERLQAAAELWKADVRHRLAWEKKMKEFA